MVKNQKINWIVETGYDEDIERVIDKIKSFGDNVLSGNTLSYKFKEVTEFIKNNPDCPTMTLGSIRTCNWVMKEIASPGAICNLKNYKCSQYYHYYHKYLLNKKHIYIPFNNLLNSHNAIVDFFNGNWFESVFIRPDSGAKLFTGEVVSLKYKKFEEFVKSLNETAMTDQMVLIAPTEGYFSAEYRVFCKKDSVLCGSQYRKGSEIYRSETVPEKIYKYAQNVISEANWWPDTLYCIDIAEMVDSRLKVIELNSLSASGFYLSNLDILIPAIRETVFEESQNL